MCVCVCEREREREKEEDQLLKKGGNKGKTNKNGNEAKSGLTKLDKRMRKQKSVASSLLFNRLVSFTTFFTRGLS